MTQWFRALGLVALVALSTSALAGPNVAQAQLKQLPAEVNAAFEPGVAEIAALEQAIEKASAEADIARTGIKADKLDSKAAEARIKADKAELKAAKKAKDKAAKKAAKAKIDASKTQADVASADVDTAAARHKLALAQVDLLQAELDLKRARLEHQRAQAVLDNELEIDVNIYASAQSKAEIAYEEARAAVSLAEAKVSMRGGDPAGGEAAPAPTTP